jgi:hypothetical protein
MKATPILLALSLFAALPAVAGPAKSSSPAWSVNATVIEACTCPVLCQAVVDREVKGDEGAYLDPPHYCRFNAAFRVDTGRYGDVRLDGAKFWVSGDFGADPSKGVADWAILTFDRATTEAQRSALTEVFARLMPAKWTSLTTAVGDIQWNPGRTVAWAALDGGETAEIRLKAFRGAASGPVMVENLRYFGASRTRDFTLMPNVLEALRKGDHAFESRGTAGFTASLTVDSGSAPLTGSSY